MVFGCRTEEKVKKVPPVALNFVPRVINGAVAGMCGATATYPLDLAKTRLQSQTVGPKGEVIYKNVIHCIQKTLRYEGFFGIYRGLVIELIFITPEKVLKLVTNDFFRYYLRDNNNELTLPCQMIAGGMAGVVQISVSTPRGLLKIQLQDTGRRKTEAYRQGNKALLKKIVKHEGNATLKGVAQKIIEKKGFRGLYRGIYPTAIRDITFNILYFPSFAYVNSLGPRKCDDSGEAVFWWTFLSGIITAAGAAFFVTPADVIKTRLQMDATKFRPKYKNAMHCFRKTLEKEGWRSFYRGSSSRVMEIAPLFAILQSVYYLGIGEYLWGVKQRRNA